MHSFSVKSSFSHIIWHENLHGIKFYGFTVGDTTVKLKSVKFYSINSTMSLLKIQRRTWPTMMPDLIKAIAYGSPIFPSSFLKLNSSFTTGVQTNTAFQFKRSSEIVAISARDYVKRASSTWASVKLKSVNFYFLNNLDKP